MLFDDQLTFGIEPQLGRPARCGDDAMSSAEDEAVAGADAETSNPDHQTAPPILLASETQQDSPDSPDPDLALSDVDLDPIVLLDDGSLPRPPEPTASSSDLASEPHAPSQIPLNPMSREAAARSTISPPPQQQPHPLLPEAAWDGTVELKELYEKKRYLRAGLYSTAYKRGKGEQPIAKPESQQSGFKLGLPMLYGTELMETEEAFELPYDIRRFAELRTGTDYTAGRGYGLRATGNIPPNTLLMEYRGEILSQDTCMQRMETIYRDHECYYFLNYAPGEVIDAGMKGTEARFVNHSCQPNCRIEKWSVNGEFALGLFSSEEIEEGAELTYDYRYESFGPMQPCLCGAANCRGFIGVNKKVELPKEKKDVTMRPQRRTTRNSELVLPAEPKDDVASSRRVSSRIAAADEKVEQPKEKNGEVTYIYLHRLLLKTSQHADIAMRPHRRMTRNSELLLPAEPIDDVTSSRRVSSRIAAAVVPPADEGMELSKEKNDVAIRPHRRTTRISELVTPADPMDDTTSTRRVSSRTASAVAQPAEVTSARRVSSRIAAAVVQPADDTSTRRASSRIAAAAVTAGAAIEGQLESKKADRGEAVDMGIRKRSARVLKDTNRGEGDYGGEGREVDGSEVVGDRLRKKRRLGVRK